MGDFEGGQPKKKVQVDPGAGPSSLFIFSDTNFIRRFTLFLIEWPPFEYTILLTIIGMSFFFIHRQTLLSDDTELATMNV